MQEHEEYLYICRLLYSNGQEHFAYFRVEHSMCQCPPSLATPYPHTFQLRIQHIAALQQPGPAPGNAPRVAPRVPRCPPGRPKETAPSRCCRTPTYLADPGICSVRDRTPRLPRRDPPGAPRRPHCPPGRPPGTSVRPGGAPKETNPSRCCRMPTYLADPGICSVRDGTPRLPRRDLPGAPRRPRCPPGRPPGTSVAPGAPPKKRPPPKVAVRRRIWRIPGFALCGTGPPGHLAPHPGRHADSTPREPCRLHTPGAMRTPHPGQSLGRPRRPPCARSQSLGRPRRPPCARSQSLGRPRRPSCARSQSLGRPRRPLKTHRFLEGYGNLALRRRPICYMGGVPPPPPLHPLSLFSLEKQDKYILILRECICPKHSNNQSI
jgi:hypothetical protein